MFKFFILSFLFFIFFIFLFGFSVVRFFFQAFLGRPSKKQTQSQRNTKSKQQSRPEPTPAPKKIITRDEGEYVDYEEVKD